MSAITDTSCAIRRTRSAAISSPPRAVSNRTGTRPIGASQASSPWWNAIATSRMVGRPK